MFEIGGHKENEWVSLQCGLHDLDLIVIAEGMT